MNRRQFTRSAVLAAGGALVGEVAHRMGSPRMAQAQTAPSLPTPDSSGIEHIVVVTMENRSFDHLFGWLPNADGRQAGLVYLDRNGVPRSTYSLSRNYTGCPAADPDHSIDILRLFLGRRILIGFSFMPPKPTAFQTLSP